MGLWQVLRELRRAGAHDGTRVGAPSEGRGRRDRAPGAASSGCSQCQTGMALDAPSARLEWRWIPGSACREAPCSHLHQCSLERLVLPSSPAPAAPPQHPATCQGTLADGDNSLTPFPYRPGRCNR